MAWKGIELLKTAFAACVNWFDQLVSATGSGNIILGAFTIVLIIGMLFIPMRGSNIVGDFKPMSDFTKTAINKSKGSSIGFRSSSKSANAGKKTSLGTVKE